SDDLFVDDVLLVYNPSIRMGAIPQSQFLIGEELTIDYTLTGTMSPENLNQEPNQVIAQLSTANGSFGAPIELGRVTTDVSGSLTVTIPQGIFVGEHYRIRLVTTNYPMVSEDNGFDITISTNDAVAENNIDEVPFGVELYDLSGRPVSNGNLAPGIYIKKYRTTHGCTVQKIVKR
ncbi:MAG: hypothetical protein J6X40_00035, partial [Bacteroidales bacterium]|nr:hypothetical protein [Bacteroidales bacterium]